MKKYIAELIGTFALVFCGTGAIVIDQETKGSVSHVGVAITFGLIVMAMIYALGNISGAHLNPAVSIAFTIARLFPVKQLLPYIISQVIAKSIWYYKVTISKPLHEGRRTQAVSAMVAEVSFS